MAEVTGQIGDQPVQLNNAATEATLKQLLAAMLASVAQQSKNTKKDAKIQQDLEAELRKLAKGAASAKKAQDDSIEAIKENTKKTEESTESTKKKTKADADAKKAQEEYKKSLEETAAMYGKLNAALESGIGYINKVTSSFTNMGSSVSAAAQSMSAIPVVGNMLAGVFGTVAGAAEKSYKAFQQSASVGANFGGSINDMIRASTDAGMTFDQFSGVVAKNGEALALLGGSTRDGAKRLAELGKEIKKSPLMGELAGLGYSTEEVNSGMAKYSSMLAKTGQLSGKSNAELVAGSAEYLKNLDQLSRLTGQSKDALQAQQDALNADAQYRSRLQDMDEAGQARLNKLMLSLPASLQKGAKEFIAFGGATSDAGREFATFMQKGAGASNAAFREIEQSGTLSQKGADAVYNAIKEDADALKKSGTGKLIANVGNGAQQAIALDAMNLSARKKTTSDIQVEQEKELQAAKEKLAKTKEALNPQDMMKFQQSIAEISNRFTEMVANNIGPLQTAFMKLAGFVESYILPAFTMIAKHIEVVVVGMLALKVAQLAYKAALAIEKMKEGKRPAGTSTDKIHVTGDGGGLDGPDKKGKGGKGGKAGGLKSAGGLVKGVAAIGAVTALVGLYDDIKDVNKEVEKGDITEREGTVKKGEAVGGAAGTAGGAWAGAAAGAAIGSVVPVVGTVVGGLIGGAIGGWLGKKGGEAIGGAVTEAVTELSMDDLKKNKDLYKKYLDRYNESIERNIKLGKSKADAEKLAMEEANKAFKIKKEEVKVTKEKIEADAKAAKAAAEKADGDKKADATPPPALNFTDPQKLFDSYKQRQTGQGPQIAPPSGTQSGTAPTPNIPSSPVSMPPPNQDQAKNMELIKAALQKQGITDPKYIAATLGNVMKETGGKSMSENLNYSKTSNDRIRSIFGSRAAGKTDEELNQIKSEPSKMGEMMYGSTTKMGKQMGNTEPGDGWKFRGRGFIQLTGKSNYAAASKAIYGDDRLVQNPDLVNDPAVAAEVSAWYMKKGQTQMAAKMGIDTKNMSQSDANLLATSQIAGTDVRKAGGYLGGEVMNKVTGYANQMAGIAGTAPSVAATTALADNKKLTQAAPGTDDQRKALAQAELDKKFQAHAGTLASGTPAVVARPNVTPTQPAVASTITPAVPTTNTQAQAAQTNQNNQQVAQNQTNGNRQPGAAGVSSATLNDVVTSLEMLNKQIGQLIAISRATADLNESQLRVQKGLGGNMFLSA